MKVVVVGDTILDEYVTVAVSRLAQEAPIPVLDAQDIPRVVAGGAANVANNLASLGVNTAFVSVVSEAFDAAVQQRLHTAVHFLGVRCPSYVIPVKRRYVTEGPGAVLVRVDSEDENVPSDETEAALLRSVEEQLTTDDDPADILVVIDYSKGVLSQAARAELVHLARRRRMPLIVACRPSDVIDYEDAARSAVSGEPSWSIFAFVLNESEVESLGGDLPSARYAVVTRGARGAAVFSQEFGDTVLEVPAPALVPASVVGAGDSFIAGLVSRLDCDANGWRLGHEALHTAVAAGSASVMCPGTAVVTLHDAWAIRLILETSSKWLGHAQLVGVADRRCKPAVFTNGCFDLLHDGHRSLLRWIKEQYPDHVLIVGVNSDDSVGTLKPGRPVRNFVQRVDDLMGCKEVDFVTAITELTPDKVLDLLRPDVLVKGAEYEGTSVPGAEFAGRLVFAPMLPGVSTTLLLERA